MTYMHLMHMVRTVHIHLSMALLGLLLLFTTTGIYMGISHQWDMENPSVVQRVVTLPADMELGSKPEQTQRLESYLGLSGALDSVDDAEPLLVVYRRPGKLTEVSIDRTTRKAQIRIEDRGVMGYLSDLHRLKYTRPGWLWMVPLAGGLVLLLTLTGVWLWWHHHFRRKWGLFWLVLGLAAAGLAAWL